MTQQTHTEAPTKRKRVKTRTKLFDTYAVQSEFGLALHIGHRLRNPLNDRIHWAEKRRMKERLAKLVADVDRPLAVTKVTFVRWYPARSKPFDEGDNLPASFKWFRDAACEWLGVNDDPSCGVTFAYEQHVADAYGVSVRFA